MFFLMDQKRVVVGEGKSKKIQEAAIIKAAGGAVRVDCHIGLIPAWQNGKGGFHGSTGAVSESEQ